MNQSFQDGVQFAWDATSLNLAQTCLRKYYLKMIEGWEPKRLSVHLLFGQHYATALEHFYKHRAEGDSSDEALHKVVREILENTWDREKNEPVQFDHAAKTRFSLVRSIVWYIDQFADEKAQGIKTHHLADGKPAVELSFSFEIEDGLLFCGHLDRVVDYGGELYCMDQKTTGNTITSYFFNQFSPDNQMSLYTLAGQIILKSPVKGVIIDGAQIAVGFTRFERGITTRTKKQLDEWLDGAHYVISLTQQATRAGHFPMNPTACGNYGGCEFRGVCSVAPELRTQYLKADFVQKEKTWDPLERR